MTTIDIALTAGEILYDPSAMLARELPLLRDRWPATPPVLSESEVCASRFHQSHVLDKVRGRLSHSRRIVSYVTAAALKWGYIVRTAMVDG